jgi:phosphatidylinositol alpha-1,6-mannosyltransferase
MVVVSHLLNMGKVALAVKRLTGTPYAVILHGFDVAQASSTTWWKSLAAKEILDNADLVICNSSFTASFARSFGVKDEHIALVNPPPWLSLDESASTSAVAKFRKNNGLGDKFTLLTVTRLVKRKGVDTVIDAVAKLRKAGKDIDYVIIGDGPDKGRLKHLAHTAGVTDSVKFLGAMKPDTLAVPYTACDAFVMVPRSEDGGDVEGYGIVYLEANIFAKPVIGSRTGGVPEAVLDGETGLLVEPDNADELAAAITRLMDDAELRQKLGEGGRERLRRDYGDNRQARRFLAAVRKASDRARKYAEQNA